MKKYRVELELIIEAHGEEHADAIANYAASKCWYQENVKESLVVFVTEMDDENT